MPSATKKLAAPATTPPRALHAIQGARRRVIRLLGDGTVVTITGNPAKFALPVGMRPDADMAKHGKTRVARDDGVHVMATKAKRVVNGNYCRVDARAAIVNGAHCVVNGDESEVNGDDCIVYGDYCTVYGNRAMIWGNHAVVHGECAVIRGVVYTMHATTYTLDGGGIVRRVSKGDRIEEVAIGGVAQSVAQ